MVRGGIFAAVFESTRKCLTMEEGAMGFRCHFFITCLPARVDEKRGSFYRTVSLIGRGGA